MNKAVTTQEGTDVGTIKNVIIDPKQKDVILEVSKGPLRGEMKVPWTQIASIGDRIVLTEEGQLGGEHMYTTPNPEKKEQKQIGSIEVLYYTDCPHYKETLQTIRDLLSEEGLSADVRETDLTEAPHAEKVQPSVSSPTILLNGTDIAPAFDDYYGPRGGHCRIYEYEGEMYPYPPKELIRESLRRQYSRSEAKIQPEAQRETTEERRTVPEKQASSRDYPSSPDATKTSQEEKRGKQATPQQTADSIEERRNRQLEAGMPTSQKETRK